jgi:hypothetical protein
MASNVRSSSGSTGKVKIVASGQVNDAAPAAPADVHCATSLCSRVCPAIVRIPMMSPHCNDMIALIIATSCHPPYRPDVARGRCLAGALFLPFDFGTVNRHRPGCSWSGLSYRASRKQLVIAREIGDRPRRVHRA